MRSIGAVARLLARRGVAHVDLDIAVTEREIIIAAAGLRCAVIIAPRDLQQVSSQIVVDPAALAVEPHHRGIGGLPLAMRGDPASNRAVSCSSALGDERLATGGVFADGAHTLSLQKCKTGPLSPPAPPAPPRA